MTPNQNEVKASIKAEAARAKKAKVKERKHAHEANTELQVKNKADGKRSAGDAPARKRVAFA
ncbi:hypothetical protein PHLCEN_2v12019 [Hermanssonia centrifuga]|uniref:Uncharacterized protein n=1 Tax=Hermanssonia centrifuga TaxID=98765 RepID=A0A2R6NI94_9APHY|nr:hypothetical protein PHLCEN_2v12019 [Hermanssonia centrifuga]